MNNQAAITLMKGLEQSLDDYCELNDEGKTAFRMAITALELFGNSEQLPSAQPEPKEGHWIKHESHDGGEQYECSECGVLWEFNDGTPEDNEAYFCPKCGTKMKGEAND